MTKITDPAILAAIDFLNSYYAELGTLAPANGSRESQHAIIMLSAYIRAKSEEAAKAPVTVASIKEQLANLIALKKEYADLRYAQSDLKYGDPPEKAEKFRSDEARLMNAVYDASRYFSDMFYETFGVHPSRLDDVTNNFGYCGSKEHPGNSKPSAFGLRGAGGLAIASTARSSRRTTMPRCC